MRSLAVRLLFILCLFSSQSTAFAVTEGWYAGFNLGSADVKEINESDLGYKFYGGYLSKYIGGEMTLVGLGDNYTIDNVDIYGMTLEFVGRVPVSDNFSLLGRFGIFWWTVSNCYYGYYFGVCSQYDDGSDLTYGVGIQYDLNANISLRAEWQQYDDVSGSDVEFISGGLMYTF